MTDALHLILGDEELLVERAVTSVLHAVRVKQEPIFRSIGCARVRWMLPNSPNC